MREIFSSGLGAFRITLSIKDEDEPVRPYRVTYGKQSRAFNTYEQAARDLGSCIMHSLACDGLIPDSIEED